jgi:hypothetical protein
MGQPTDYGLVGSYGLVVASASTRALGGWPSSGPEGIAVLLAERNRLSFRHAPTMPLSGRDARPIAAVGAGRPDHRPLSGRDART